MNEIKTDYTKHLEIPNSKKDILTPYKALCTSPYLLLQEIFYFPVDT